MKISEQIKEWRIYKGMTQAELAVKLNVKPNAVSQYESGKRTIHYDLLEKIAEVLEVSIVFNQNGDTKKHKEISEQKANIEIERTLSAILYGSSSVSLIEKFGLEVKQVPELKLLPAFYKAINPQFVLLECDHLNSTEMVECIEEIKNYDPKAKIFIKMNFVGELPNKLIEETVCLWNRREDDLKKSLLSNLNRKEEPSIAHIPSEIKEMLQRKTTKLMKRVEKEFKSRYERKINSEFKSGKILFAQEYMHKQKNRYKDLFINCHTSKNGDYGNYFIKIEENFATMEKANFLFHRKVVTEIFSSSFLSEFTEISGNVNNVGYAEEQVNTDPFDTLLVFEFQFEENGEKHEVEILFPYRKFIENYQSGFEKNEEKVQKREIIIEQNKDIFEKLSKGIQMQKYRTRIEGFSKNIGSSVTMIKILDEKRKSDVVCKLEDGRMIIAYSDELSKLAKEYINTETQFEKAEWIITNTFGNFEWIEINNKEILNKIECNSVNWQQIDFLTEDEFCPITFLVLNPID